MSKKEARQKAIEVLVRTEQIRTQRELVERLEQRGFACTQATVSRDITELDLVKSPQGFYAVRVEDNLTRLVFEMVEDIDWVGSFCVIRTQFGKAINVADAIDRAQLEDVIGTVAGTDTILVICTSDEGSSRTASYLATLVGSKVDSG